MEPIDATNTSSSEASSLSFGSLLEKIEIMRSSLRWPQHLERPQIEKLLRQTGTLREDVLRLSRVNRLSHTLNQSPAPAENLSLKQRREGLVARDFQFDGVFGDSPKLIESLEIAEKAAPTDLPVLIEGESGTGKELMAKVIHANGVRSDAALITVNCGAIPDNLLESELFGHKRGAFTGASADRAGKFEAANGGTIFLDEIGELPLNGQVKLLRVLQSNEIQRVGSDKTVLVDARIVAATNRDLLKMCEAGTFREDLYYRLSIIQITAPALRERRDEIPLLMDYLGEEAAGRLKRPPIQYSPKLKQFLLNYDYPGNIRELRNVIFRLSCLAGETADLEHLPPHFHKRRSEPGKPESVQPSTPGIIEPVQATPPTPTDTAADPAADTTAESAATPSASVEAAMNIDDISLTDAKRLASDIAEKRFLETGLVQTGGNVTKLAKRMEMNRTHVQTLLKKHDISSKDFRNAISSPALNPEETKDAVEG